MPSTGTFHGYQAGLLVTAAVSSASERRAWLCLNGEVDLATSALLARTVDWLTAEAPASALIDLAEVTFAGSALPHFVVGVSAALPEGAELILWRSAPAARLVLRSSDLAAISTLCDDPVTPAS